MRAAAAHRRRDAGPSATRPHSARAGLLSLTTALWLMVWGGYNTDIARLSEPGFPASTLDLFQGLRALLPLMAAFLAVITLLARRRLPLWSLRGPLGLLGLYALIGLISSLLLSREPLTALYWGAQYISVMLVIWVALADPNPLTGISRVIKPNWIIVALLALGPIAADVFDPNVVLRPGGMMQVADASNPDEILGMPATRSTGVARYAAIAGLLALARLWQANRRSKIFWCLLLLFSLSVVVYLQARTALLGLLVGTFLLLWLRRSSRLIFLIGGSFAAILLALTGSYQAIWAYLMRGQSFDPTLTGRTVTWEQGWPLFLDSPLLGLGFHADRIFLEGQHMSNAVLHALIQSGLLGTIPFVAALAGAWVLLYRLYWAPLQQGLSSWPLEIVGVIVFFSVESITESTIAFFGSALLLVAPCFAYLQAAMRQRQAAELRNALERPPRLSFPRQPKDTAAATAPGALQHATGRG